MLIVTGVEVTKQCEEVEEESQISAPRRLWAPSSFRERDVHRPNCTQVVGKAGLRTGCQVHGAESEVRSARAAKRGSCAMCLPVWNSFRTSSRL